MAPLRTASAVSSVVCRAIWLPLLRAWEIKLHAIGSSTRIFQLKTSIDNPSAQSFASSGSLAATAALLMVPSDDARLWKCCGRDQRPPFCNLNIAKNKWL